MDNAINKIVTEAALNQVQSLIDKVLQADEAFIKLSQSAFATNKILAVPPKTSDALNKQLQESQRLIKELQADYKKQETALANLQKKYESLAQTKKSVNATDRQTIIDNREIRKELDGQAIANSNLTSYIQKLSVERAKASRIVADYNAQVAMGTQLTEEQAAELAQATSAFQKYDNAIKAGKKSIGDAREYVGQYERANWGLQNSVNQLTRELPALGMNAQTFFLAISNNIGPFKDAIDDINVKNAQLRAEGKVTTSVWQQLGSTLLSWNTLLSVGVTLLVVYGKELANFTSELFGASKAMKTLADNEKKFAEARLQGKKDAQGNIIDLKTYLAVYNDLTVAEYLRNTALEKAKTQFKDYIKTAADAKITNGQYSKSVQDLFVALEKQKELEGKSEIIAQNRAVLEQLQEELKLNNAKIKQAEKDLEIDSKKAKINDRATAQAQRNETLKLQENLNRLKEKGAKIDSEIKKANDDLLKQEKDAFIIKNTTIRLEVEDTKATEENTRAIKLNTKAREDYLASEYELWRLRKQNESDRNKDIMNDEASGYELRLMASEQYYQNELDLANRAAQEELRVLAFAFEEQKRISENEFINYQDGLKKKLSEDKLSKEQRVLIEKELADSKKQFINDQTAMVKDNANKQNIIYENQAQRLIDINLQVIGIMQRAWDEINFGKADIEIANVDLKGLEKIGEALKGVGKNLSSGEIERELQKINDLSRDLALDIAKREADLQVTREENNVKLLIDEILMTATIMNLSDEQTEKLLINNKALQDAELKLIEAKKQKAKVDNDVTDSEVKNSQKLQKQKEEEFQYILESAIRLSNDLQGLTDTLFQRGVDNYDRQIEKNNEYYDALLENAERGSEQEQMLQEEKERKENELQRRKVALQRKQAIFNKILALAEIAVNLQLELAKNRASTGTIPGGLLDGIAIASAAIRTATVLATPLPQYKDGRGKGKDEFAVVGDGGRSEVIERASGKLEVTPNVPTITHLGKDDIVHKSLEDFERSKLAIQNASIMASFGNQSRQLEMFDYYLGKELRGISNKIEKGIEKGFKKAKIQNYIKMPPIDIGHLDYKNRGLT